MKQEQPRRGRPPLSEEERKDPKARRLFYQPTQDYELIFAFCEGDISRELPRMMALWMCVSAETRDAVSNIVVKGKPLQEAVKELDPVLPELLLNEVLARYITALPQDKKIALLAGQPITLPPGGGLKKGKR